MTITVEPPSRVRVTAKWLAVVALVMAWVLVIYVPYFVVHKPFPVSLAQVWELNRRLLAQGFSRGAIGETLANLGAGVLIAVIATGLGWRLLRLWPENVAGRPKSPRYSPVLTRLCFSAGLGFGVLGLAAFILAAGGMLYDWAIYAVLGTAALWMLSALRHGVPTWPDRGQILGSARLSGFELLLVVYVGLSVLLALGNALAPPTGWDSLVYHLTAPKLSLQIHGLNAGVDVAHFYFPELVESLFAIALAIKGPIAAQLIHFTFLPLTLVALYGFAQTYFDRRVALTTCAIFTSASSILALAAQAYVDIALTFFLFLSFWALCEAVGFRTREGGRHRPSSRSWLVLSGLFAGLGMGVKYTSAPFVVGLALLVLWVHLPRSLGLRRISARRDILPALGWGAIALVVASPWYLKNLVLTGNPIYPFVFGGWAWDAWRAEWYLRAGTGFLSEPLRLVLAPLEMTVLGVEGGEGYQATIGPLFLLTLPLLILVGRRRRVRWGLFVCAVVYVPWLAGVAESRLLQQTRLLLPIFSLLSFMGAAAVEELWIWNRPVLNLQRVMRWVLLLALGLTLVTQVVDTGVVAPWGVAVGAESQENYLTRRLGGYYTAMRSLDEQLPEKSRVWMLWEPRSFYTSRAVQADALLDNWPHALRLFGTPEKIRAYLRSEGYTHVLIHRAGLDFFLTPPNREVDEDQVEALRVFERNELRLLWGDGLDAVQLGSDPSTIGGRYALYALR